MNSDPCRRVVDYARCSIDQRFSRQIRFTVVIAAYLKMQQTRNSENAGGAYRKPLWRPRPRSGQDRQSFEYCGGLIWLIDSELLTRKVRPTQLRCFKPLP